MVHIGMATYHASAEKHLRLLAMEGASGID
jgi:hypothetical protein